MSEHPTASELEGLVRGDLRRKQARLVARHLLRGCESCVAQIAPYASMVLAGPAARRRASRRDGTCRRALGRTFTASLRFCRFRRAAKCFAGRHLSRSTCAIS